MNTDNKINVEGTEEFKEWSRGKSQSTKYHYKSLLQRFCNFHEMTPSELLEEAHKENSKSEKPWLEKNPADKRLQKWYTYLTNPKNKDGKGIAKNTAQTYWKYIKSFYEKFGVEITIETPKAPNHTNSQPEYKASDVREMVYAVKNARDQAIILCGFQGGMDPQEICRLIYGQVKEAIKENKYPYLIEKTRKKTKVRHHAPILKDGVKALQRYISQRKKKEENISDEDPLFVKTNGERIEPKNIRFIMRQIRDRVIDQISEAKRIAKKSTINPLAPKYLRKAFGIACSNAKIDRVYKEYWMGHAEPYDGAYSGKITKENQLEELGKLKSSLSISTPKEELEEKIDERINFQDKRIETLEEEKTKQRKEIQELEEKAKYLEEKLEKTDKNLEITKITTNLRLTKRYIEFLNSVLKAIRIDPQKVSPDRLDSLKDDLKYLDEISPYIYEGDTDIFFESKPEEMQEVQEKTEERIEKLKKAHREMEERYYKFMKEIGGAEELLEGKALEIYKERHE